MDNNLYQTPKTTHHDSSPTGITGPYGAFRQNGTLKIILASLLVVDAMLSIFSSGVLNLLDTKQQKGQEFELTGGASKLDKIISFANSIHIVVIIALIITFAAWINRSCKNGWLLDAPHMRTSPRLSVGYYFTPILSLWKPYSTMKEIRRASYGNDNALKSILPLWWTLWLTSNLLGLIILNAEIKESYLMASKLDLISVPITATLNYLAIALITSITAAQSRRKNYWSQ